MEFRSWFYFKITNSIQMYGWPSDVSGTFNSFVREQGIRPSGEIVFCDDFSSENKFMVGAYSVSSRDFLEETDPTIPSVKIAMSEKIGNGYPTTDKERLKLHECLARILQGYNPDIVDVVILCNRFNISTLKSYMENNGHILEKAINVTPEKTIINGKSRKLNIGDQPRDYRYKQRAPKMILRKNGCES